MNVAQAPDWIKDMKSKYELDKLASLRITKEGPDFWFQLFNELESTTRSLQSIGSGYSGRTSNTSKPNEVEKRYRVDVALSGRSGGLTYTDLFYRPGDSKIRSQTKESERLAYVFCIWPKGSKIAVRLDNESAPLYAREMAEMIVKDAMSRAPQQVF